MQATSTPHRTQGLAFVLLLALSLACARVDADEGPDVLEQADAALDALEDVVRHPSIVARRQLEVLNRAAEAMGNLRGPERPSLLPVPAGSSGTEAIASENQRRLRRWVRARDDFARKAETRQVRWVKLLGKTIRSHSVRYNSYMSVWDAALADRPVSVHALELLVATERVDAAREVTGATKAILRQERKYGAYRSLLPALFDALPRFRSSEVLDWLRETFVGREKQHRMWLSTVTMGPNGLVTTRVELPVLVLRTIAECTEAPGPARRRMVRDLVRHHACLEEKAESHTGLDGFWMRILELSTEAARLHAGVPTDDAGKPLDTLAALRTWLARHRDTRKEPWSD